MKTFTAKLISGNLSAKKFCENKRVQSNGFSRDKCEQQST